VRSRCSEEEDGKVEGRSLVAQCKLSSFGCISAVVESVKQRLLEKQSGAKEVCKSFALLPQAVSFPFLNPELNWASVGKENQWPVQRQQRLPPILSTLDMQDQLAGVPLA